MSAMTRLSENVFTKHGIRTNKNLTSKIMRRYFKRQKYLLNGARPSEGAHRG